MKLLPIALLLLVSIAALAPGQTQQRIAFVHGRTQLRELPSIDADKIKDVPAGAAVKVLEIDGEWAVVRMDNNVGWVPVETLRIVTVGVPTTSLQSNIPSVPQTTPAPAPSESSGGYNRGPRGGCYRISKSGRKVYVDRSLCN